MSIKIITEVLSSSHTAGTKRLLMVVLADHANDEGYCYPSVIGMATKCNTSERNVQLMLRELEETGELTVDVAAGRGHKSEYWVRPPATLDRLIQEYQELLSRAKTNPEKVKFSAELEKVKFSAEKVKNSAQKVKFSAEKVKPSSPEPSVTIKKPSSNHQSPETPEIQGDENTGMSPEGDNGTPADAGHQGPASLFQEPQTPASDFPSSEKQKPKSSGRGGSAKTPDYDPLTYPIPEWIPAEIWEDWCAHRKDIKKPLTERAAKATVSSLEAFRIAGHDPVKLINTSIANGWQGIIEPRYPATKPQQQQQAPQNAPRRTFE